jgi:hypothetical protein
VNGLVLLTLSLIALVAYFNGQLEWLFNLGSNIGAARASTERRAPFAPPPNGPTGTAPGSSIPA